MDLQQIGLDILAGRYTSFDKGVFGSVYHIDKYIVKKINIDVKEDVHFFLAEDTIFKRLSSIPEMQRYIPTYHASTILYTIGEYPELPQTTDVAVFLAARDAAHAWLTKAYAEKRILDYGGKEPYAYGFIFQLFEPTEMLLRAVNRWEKEKEKEKEKDKGKLSAARGQELMLDLIRGFETLHRNGFIHRDIKLDNILLRPNLSPIIIDFGLACEITDVDEDGRVYKGCTNPYEGIDEYNPQNYLPLHERKNVPRIKGNTLRSVKRGYLWNTYKTIRVTTKKSNRPNIKQINSKAWVVNTVASDNYTLSIAVLRPLLKVIDWSRDAMIKRRMMRHIEDLERQIVPHLAAGVAIRKRVLAEQDELDLESESNSSRSKSSKSKSKSSKSSEE